jgi:hypothetical protein
MTRRSPRKKAISPVTVPNYSDDEEFAPIASDDQYMIFLCLNLIFFLIFIFCSIDICTSDDESAESHQEVKDSNHGKKSVNLVRKGKLHSVSVRKNEAADVELEGDEL